MTNHEVHEDNSEENETKAREDESNRHHCLDKNEPPWLEPVTDVLKFGRINPMTTRKSLIVLVRWMTVIAETEVPQAQSDKWRICVTIGRQPVRTGEGNEEQDPGDQTEDGCKDQSLGHLCLDNSHPLFGDRFD